MVAPNFFMCCQKSGYDLSTASACLISISGRNHRMSASEEPTPPPPPKEVPKKAPKPKTGKKNGGPIRTPTNLPWVGF